MKRITISALLPIMLASTALAKSTAYVQEIVGASANGRAVAKSALNIVRSAQIRLHFASAFGFPTFREYTEEKLAEGISEQEINELYNSMFISSELQDFEIEQALTDDSRLRAGVIASAYLASAFLGAFTKSLGISTKEEIEEHLKQLPQSITYSQFLTGITQSAMTVATGLALIFPAVDSPDKSLDTIINDLTEIHMIKFDLLYSDAYPDRVPEESNLEPNSAIAFAVTDATGNVIGGNVGDYLRRTNHVTPAPINDSEKRFLDSIGITDEGILALMPTGLPRYIASVTMSGVPILGNDPNRVGDLDYAIVIDLLNEPGSLFPLTVTPQIIFDQQQYDYFRRYLDEELDYLHITVDELVPLLRHPKRPASLLQVLQLLHRDFSLEDIAVLEYETRDAIIIANAKNKEHLFDEVSYALSEYPTLESLNELIRSKGQLTLALLDKGYDIEDISPHFSPKRSPAKTDEKADTTKGETKGEAQ